MPDDTISTIPSHWWHIQLVHCTTMTYNNGICSSQLQVAIHIPAQCLQHTPPPLWSHVKSVKISISCYPPHLHISVLASICCSNHIFVPSVRCCSQSWGTRHTYIDYYFCWNQLSDIWRLWMQIRWCGSNWELTLPPVNIVLQGWVNSAVINPRHGHHNLSDKLHCQWKTMNILFIYQIQVKAIIFRFISSTPFEFVRTQDHAACRIFHEYTVHVVVV